MYTASSLRKHEEAVEVRIIPKAVDLSQGFSRALDRAYVDFRENPFHALG
jgi:hypothetical protein